MKYNALSGVETDAYYPASKVLESATTITPQGYYIIGINQQTGKTYSEVWDGTTTSTAFGSTWDEGYYRVHITYNAIADGKTVSVNLEKKPLYWNKSKVAWMLYVAPGSYLCGSPTTEIGRSSNENQHRVTISKGFYLSRCQMTVQQYNAIMGKTASTSIKPKASICYSYYNYLGQEYINNAWAYPSSTTEPTWPDMIYASTGHVGSATGTAINSPNGLIETMESSLAVSDWKWELPTEAQWEFACRAGVNSGFNNGKNPSFSDGTFDENLSEIAWYVGNNTPSGTKDVARKLPNRWGLYDMEGNVWEWLYDYLRSYTAAAENSPDPVGTLSSSNRGCRGGGYNYNANNCRCAGFRNYYRVSNVYTYLGLRPSLQSLQ
jgi:formylglycine-generating enzyme required for sulfatase activity